MSEREVRLSTRAYALMALHAARYPHAAVCGLLLAEAGTRSSIHLQDAVPLFHQCLHVTPMYEVALTQVEAAAKQAGRVVAGMYVACENLHHNTAEKTPDLRVADKIAEYFPDAVLLVLDNRRLTQSLSRPPFTLYTHGDAGWRPREPSALVTNAESSDAVSALLQGGVQRQLVDLDCHLDDLRQDWSNQALLRSLPLH